MRHERSLDALNFFLADVRQGLGPYLANFLVSDAGVDSAARTSAPEVSWRCRRGSRDSR
jgi:hypothetical protein